MSQSDRPGRSWALETARQLLSEVRDHTRKAVERVDPLVAERETLAAADPRAREIDAEVRAAVDRWTRTMEALGLDVCGPWCVGFDNGSGYYCWRWPEPALEWFRGYDDDHEARVRIQ